MTMEEVPVLLERRGPVGILTIDRDTSAEDRQLSIWSNESMKSHAFDGFHLSDLEYGLRRHHDAYHLHHHQQLLNILR